MKFKAGDTIFICPNLFRHVNNKKFKILKVNTYTYSVDEPVDNRILDCICDSEIDMEKQ